MKWDSIQELQEFAAQGPVFINLRLSFLLVYLSRVVPGQHLLFSTMFTNISVLRFAICFFCSGAQATGPGFWVVPDGADSDLSQSFPANTPLDLSWTGQPALSSFTNFDNKTTAFGLFDLYVTNFQPGGKFSQLVTSKLPSSKNWLPANQ
jgi:hypothetical protein